MPKFTPDTKLRCECHTCKTREMVKLGDLPHTPKGTFFSPPFQCATCLDVCNVNVYDEDQGETDVGTTVRRT